LLKRLKVMAPGIDWTAPIPITMTRFMHEEGMPEKLEKRVGFLCRICTADKGFQPARDKDAVFDTEEACLKHIEDSHVGGRN
jgi:hypothetical protein